MVSLGDLVGDLGCLFSVVDYALCGLVYGLVCLVLGFLGTFCVWVDAV